MESSHLKWGGGGAWALVGGVGKSFSKCLQGEKLDVLETHKGALQCGKP